MAASLRLKRSCRENNEVQSEYWHSQFARSNKAASFISSLSQNPHQYLVTSRVFARRTEAPIFNTRKLFSRSAAVLGRPRPAVPLANSRAPATNKPRRITVASIRRGRPRTAALRLKSFRALKIGASVRRCGGVYAAFTSRTGSRPNSFIKVSNPGRSND